MTSAVAQGSAPNPSRLRRLFAVDTWSSRSVTIALAICALVYCLVFGFLIVQKSHTLQNSDDFAQYLQALWTTAHGEPFRTTWREVGGPGELLLGMHIELTLLLLLPIYIVWEDPASLLIVQVILVALAVFPIASTATHLLGRPAYGLMFGLAHLANPFLQRALFYDFHPESMQFLALTWAAACLIQGRFAGFAIAAVFAGLTKEDSWLHIFVLGAFALAFRPKGFARNRRTALVIIAVAITGLLVGSAVLVPAFRGAAPKTFAIKYPSLGDDIFEIIGTVFTRPDVMLGLIWDPINIDTQSRVFLLFLFLPLFSIQSLLLVAPGTLLACLTERETVKTLSVLYPFSLLFFHPFAAMLGLSRLSTIWARIDPALVRLAASTLVALASLTAMFTYGPSAVREGDVFQSYFINRFPFGPGFSWDYFADNEHTRIGRRFIRERVPAGVPLSTEYRLSAHVPNRRVLHAIDDRLEDFVFFDLNGPHYHEKPELFRSVLESGDYGLLAFENGYTLLKRGVPPGQIAEVARIAQRRAEAESLGGRTGRNTADRRVPSRFARMGRREDPRGVLVHGFVRTLDPGRYLAVYTVRAGAPPPVPGAVISLEIRDDRQRNLARRTLTSQDFAGGSNYRRIFLPFELAERTSIEIRAGFESLIDVWIDRIEIEDAPDSSPPPLDGGRSAP